MRILPRRPCYDNIYGMYSFPTELCYFSTTCAKYILANRAPSIKISLYVVVAIFIELSLFEQRDIIAGLHAIGTCTSAHAQWRANAVPTHEIHMPQYYSCET